MTREDTMNIIDYIKQWRGSSAMKNAITHWQTIVLPKKEKL